MLFAKDTVGTALLTRSHQWQGLGWLLADLVPQPGAAPRESHGPQPQTGVLSCVNDAVLSSGSNAALNGCHCCVCSCRSVGNYTWIPSNYLETRTLA